MYTNGDTALKLLMIDARERNVIRKQDGLFVYGESVLGATEDAMMLYFKTPSNKAVLDMIKKEVYPEFIRQVEIKENTISDSTSDTESDTNSKKKR